MKGFLLSTAILAPLFFGSAVSASAASCTFGNTTPPANVSPSSACGLYSGNDTNSIDSSTSLFNRTGWTLADKTDDSIAGDVNDPFYFDHTKDYSGTSGTWKLLFNEGTFANYDIFVTLKAGNNFAAYLITGLEGLWNTAGVLTNNKGNAQALSHMSAYYIEKDPPPPTAVPGPIAGAGLPALLALGGFVWARRRKAAVPAAA